MSKMRHLKKETLSEKLARQETPLRVLRAAGRVVSVVLIVMLSIAVITFFLLRSSGHSPTVFGLSMHRVASEGMEPELEKEDIILCKEVRQPAELQEGDVVLLDLGPDFDHQIIAQRVVTAPYEFNGVYILATRADADAADSLEIEFSAVQSKYIHKASFLMFVYRFFFSGWGIAIFAILLAAILVTRIRRLVRLTAEQNKLRESIIEAAQKQEDAPIRDAADAAPAHDEPDIPEIPEIPDLFDIPDVPDDDDDSGSPDGEEPEEQPRDADDMKHSLFS